MWNSIKLHQSRHISLTPLFSGQNPHFLNRFLCTLNEFGSFYGMFVISLQHVTTLSLTYLLWMKLNFPCNFYVFWMYLMLGKSWCSNNMRGRDGRELQRNTGFQEKNIRLIPNTSKTVRESGFHPPQKKNAGSLICIPTTLSLRTSIPL